ncbi:Peptidase S41 family protein ustP [Fusarium oxysporum f. sp. rapae]|uniref:Peptidase S41 family protein ustP n=1 Tax=Fusarium oxysporum f. sp. rapae TaxID=485398 RepID=A0A8J5NQ59_FUSOX|nr:Peptidase S41 family protein ustP [Fusarium oxysporum f. sp. rapae]
MPFYPELADPFLDEIGKYVQWQSTLETLKNPPDTYMSSPADILGGLEMIRPVGYPEPLIRDPYNQMNGYYLDDDTVVMMIPSFNGDRLPSNQSFTFGHYANKIISKALADGRTKLIIDVSGNPGGNVDRAFNLFKLFFPSEFPYSANRFRRHEVSEGLVKVFSAVGRSTALENALINEAGFESYEEFLGDTTQLGTPVSSLFASFNFTEASGNSDTPIRGYAGRPLDKTQPFKAENIVIIGDGLCASTCSIFVNSMTNIGGVRALPFGGHPNGRPMQIRGGVRGSQTLVIDNIVTVVSAAKAVYRETPEKLEFMTKEENERLMKVAPRPLDEFPIKLGSRQVNFLNAYQEGDDDLPL